MRELEGRSSAAGLAVLDPFAITPVDLLITG